MPWQAPQLKGALMMVPFPCRGREYLQFARKV